MSADMTGLATAAQRPNLHYDLTDPSTNIIYPCPPTGWRYEKARMQELVANKEVLFPKDPNGRPRRKKYVKDLTSNFTGFSTILNTVFNTQGTRELRTMFDDNEYFDFPKPIELIKLFLQQGATANEDGSAPIVLDFFSGSATTAHAVMQLNAEDGVNRRFIMVQLPELLDGDYKNICEIGKERIRRAGKQIQDKIKTTYPTLLEAAPTPPDTGFRVFKLDTSNLAVWDTTPISGDKLQELWERFHALTKTIKGDRSDLDIVYEVMLKMGVPLNYPVVETTAGTKKVYSIGGDILLVCLEKGITPEDIEAMCDLAPAKIIAAEEAFADDTALSNAHYILRDRGIEMKLL